MNDFEKDVDLIFRSKLNTGLYDHYNDEQLKQLYLDCVRQVKAMYATFGAWKNGISRGKEKS